MKRKISLKWIFLLLVSALIVLLSVYLLHLRSVKYEGRPLTIAVVGQVPEIKEEQVSFEEITFDDVMNNDFDSYDAIFIMPQNLSQASEIPYAKIYSDSPIPFFFIGANSHIPFTEAELDFDDDSWENWEWTPGTSYASGFYFDTATRSTTAWEFYLYDDEKTDENIEAVYTEIFNSITEI
ncbi:hypothetical protein LMF32_04070 [Desemzia sp. C1]|uniref:hypothetical protein n=1 Tax=Desemzia sp. C1 TaxID=2892016 RepID=UPI001E38DFDB|nr:hypothetical protein [Desemzia sp. C1]MCI3028283.1 hypothetical protein [Desemzia sp. C1]